MGITLDRIIVYILALVRLLIVEISRFIKAKRSKRIFCDIVSSVFSIVNICDFISINDR